MARTLTSRKDRKCGWCQEIIAEGDLMKWHSQVRHIIAVHPQCSQPAFDKDQETRIMRQNPPKKEKNSL